MRDFRYLAYSVGTQQLLAELPFESFGWNDVLDRRGGFSATIKAVQADAIERNLTPWATRVYVDDGGALRFGGYVTEVNLDGDEATNTLSIQGEGLMGAYKQRRRRILSRAGMTYATNAAGISGEPSDDISWLGVDQFRVVQDLFAHAALSAGDIGWFGIRLHGPGVGGLSNVGVTRQVWAYEKRGIADFMEDLVSFQGGFDYSVACEYSGGFPVHYLDLWSPRRGRSPLTSTLTFDIGDDVKLASYSQGGEVANMVDVDGSGTADSKVTATASAANMIFPTGAFPRLDKVVSESGVQELANLSALAVAELAASQQPLETIKLRLQNRVANAQLGQFDVGDTGYVSGDIGFKVLSGWYRIQEVAPAIDNEGNLTIDITLVTEAATLGAL